MSDQATLLGHPREALMLAGAGRRGIGEADSPACRADLHVLAGRALAAAVQRFDTHAAELLGLVA
jgi:hypothetical protein